MFYALLRKYYITFENRSSYKGCRLFEAAKKAIEEARNISLITHINVDADSYATAVGLLYFFTNTLQKNCKILNKETIPRNLQKLYPQNKIQNSLPPNCELAIFVDCATLGRSAFTKEELSGKKIMTIDHHFKREAFANIELIEDRAPATACVAYKLLKSFDTTISSSTAEALFCALASDSQFFSIDRCRQECYAIASELVALGANPVKADAILNKSESLAKLRLLGLALEHMELKLEGRVAVIVITDTIFEKTGAIMSDLEGIVEKPLALECTEISALLVKKDDHYKISLRSKNKDISPIAEKLNGGGHKKAGGGKIYAKTVEEAKNITLRTIEELF